MVELWLVLQMVDATHKATAKQIKKPSGLKIKKDLTAFMSNFDGLLLDFSNEFKK